MRCLRVLTPLPEWDRPTRAHAPTGRAFQPGPGSIHGRSVAVLPAGASGTSLLAEAAFRRRLLPGRDVLVPRRRCRLEEEAASSAPRWPEGPPRESGPISCIRLRSVVASAAASRVLRVSFPRPGEGSPQQASERATCCISEFITSPSVSTPNRANGVPTALKVTRPGAGQPQLSFPVLRSVLPPALCGLWGGGPTLGSWGGPTLGSPVVTMRPRLSPARFNVTLISSRFF